MVQEDEEKMRRALAGMSARPAQERQRSPAVSRQSRTLDDARPPRADQPAADPAELGALRARVEELREVKVRLETRLAHETMALGEAQAKLQAEQERCAGLERDLEEARAEGQRRRAAKAAAVAEPQPVEWWK